MLYIMEKETKIDLDNNILIYKGTNVFILRDEDNQLWCIGKQFARLLKY